MKTQALINKHWTMYAVPLMDKKDAHRRTLYAKEDSDQLVSNELIAQQQWKKNSQQLTNESFYKHFSQIQVLVKSQETYMKDPEKKKEFQQELIKSTPQREIQPLTREQVLEFSKLNEEYQLAFKIRMVDTFPMGTRIPAAIE